MCLIPDLQHSLGNARTEAFAYSCERRMNTLLVKCRSGYHCLGQNILMDFQDLCRGTAIHPGPPAPPDLLPWPERGRFSFPEGNQFQQLEGTEDNRAAVLNLWIF